MAAKAYLHAGGPLHGKLVFLENPGHTYVHAKLRPIDVRLHGRWDAVDNLGYDEFTYYRVNTDLFGRPITVYVCTKIGRVQDLLFDVLVSSAAKAGVVE